MDKEYVVYIMEYNSIIKESNDTLPFTTTKVLLTLGVWLWHTCASDPEQHLSKTGPAIAVTYIGSSSAVTEISDPSPSLITLQLTYL